MERVPQGLKPSLTSALCGTEAVPFVRSPAFSADVVRFVLHLSTLTAFAWPEPRADDAGSVWMRD